MRTLLALILLLALPATAAAADCDRRGSRTVRMTAQVHVYDLGDDEEWRTYACLRRRPAARSVLLGENDLRRGISGRVRVAGRFVAYSLLSVTGGTGDTHLTVAVADVARRRTRHRWNFQQFFQAPSLRVRGARLKRNGSFAFLVGPTDGPFVYGVPGGPVYHLHVADRAGRRRVDRGPRVRGFRATQRRVYWRDGEHRRSVRFR